MKRDDLLRCCRYYNGEEVQPEGSTSAIWSIERKWERLASRVIDKVVDLQGDDLELLSDELELYSRRVYHSFPNIHEISTLPPSLLGMLWSECVHIGELEFGPSDGAGIDAPEVDSPVSSSVASVKEMFLKTVKKFYG